VQLLFIFKLGNFSDRFLDQLT